MSARTKLFAILGLIVLIPVIAVLVVIPFFNRQTVVEADPFAQVALPTPTNVVHTVAPTVAVAATAIPQPTATATVVKPTSTVAIVAIPNPPVDIVAPSPTQIPTATPVPLPTATPVPTVAAKPASGPSVVGRGEFIRVDTIHWAKGSAILGKTADGKTLLRFENFSVAQGPDLKVYLGTRSDGSKVKDDGLNLGALRATDGSYNIAIPENIDVSKYKSVVIWCEAFAVLFSMASLS